MKNKTIQAICQAFDRQIYEQADWRELLVQPELAQMDEGIEDSHNLVYLRERYYDPGMGRFLSLDPVEGSMSNPMSLNRYAYGHGDPINNTDPSGKFPAGNAALPNMLNAGLCMAPSQATPIQEPDCSCYGIFAGACQRGILPSCSPIQPTSTPTATTAPTPVPTPTDSPDVNPCTTRPIFPVFGSCADNDDKYKCTPHFAGAGYNPDSHRAVDIVPVGAFENYPSTYLAPDWSTRQKTQQYNPVYAVADGTIYPLDPEVPDAIALRLSENWEFVYIHIIPSVTSGPVTAGKQLGVIIPHSQASSKYEKSDQDHLHFGLRNPSNLTQSLNPASCLLGLTG